MGFYSTQVLPRLIDRSCASPAVGAWRARTTEGLAGTLVEIGFGSGLNLPHYPRRVDQVYAVDPSQVGRKLAASRVAASPVPVRPVGLDGASLPLDDASCDAALSTFTLCTIPDVEAALGELRRVLRPGGAFHFLEHGLAPDPGVARWQRRLEPLQKRIADGCHLTREPARLVAAAGFTLDRVESEYAVKLGPKPWAYLTLGLARNPG